jgi:shikimate dehydrogenase
MYGLIGKKLSHSYSAILFEEKFGKTPSFQLIEIENINDLPEFIDKNPALLGFTVTIPYKKEIIPFIFELDEIAKECGSVNTVTVKRLEGKKILTGYNTDVYGFTEAYKNIITKACKKALILGTGGASSAVSYALKHLGIETLLVSRSKKMQGIITYSELSPEIISEHKLIINTTPLGTFPKINECPEICYSVIGKEHVVIDIIYNPEITLLMQKAELQKAKVFNGYQMLKNQAIKAWQIWGLV